MCGYYLAIGMPLEEYWNASPHLVRYYREAHKLKVKETNQELWLQGLYIYNAFAVVLANAFSKKGGKREEYLKKPIDLFGEEKPDAEAEKIKETNRVVSILNMVQQKFNENNKGKEENDSGN